MLLRFRRSGHQQTVLSFVALQEVELQSFLFLSGELGPIRTVVRQAKRRDWFIKVRFHAFVQIGDFDISFVFSELEGHSFVRLLADELGEKLLGLVAVQ